MVLVLFWDGLRPDFVKPDLTPNLCQLSTSGVTFANHHAVYPSETRVNASSVATGCYPGTHGVVGNRIYVPQVDADKALNTGNHEDLLAISQVENLLSVPTLASTLTKHKKSYAIFSSGSPGSSWVQCAPGEGNMVNVRGVVHPDQLGQNVLSQYGAFPPETVPATERNKRVSDLIIDALKHQTYDVVFGWLCDPDLTQHKVGLGAPLALDAIRQNDQRLGEILDVAKGIDVMVCSDHGFSTLADPFDHKAVFQGCGFDLEDMVWTGSGVVLKPNIRTELEDVVDVLAGQNCIGPIFSRGKGGQAEGDVSGTFSLDVPSLNHARTPDVMFSRRWSDEANEFGVLGVVYGSGGIASHGSCSPFDMHNVLIASGPHFKQSEEIMLPSGVVDIAPTVQHLVFGKPQTKMDGRVLCEGLIGERVPTETGTETLVVQRGTIKQYMQMSWVDQTRYIDKGGV